MDPLSLLAGAAIFAAGIAVGRLRRSERRPRKGARCGCGHDFAFHDIKTGECHVVTKKAVAYDKWGTAREWAEDRCACRRYSGPEPLPQYYAPELADEN
jgi:hypothetical protein